MVSESIASYALHPAHGPQNGPHSLVYHPECDGQGHTAFSERITCLASHLSQPLWPPRKNRLLERVAAPGPGQVPIGHFAERLQGQSSGLGAGLMGEQRRVSTGSGAMFLGFQSRGWRPDSAEWSGASGLIVSRLFFTRLAPCLPRHSHQAEGIHLAVPPPPRPGKAHRTHGA